MAFRNDPFEQMNRFVDQMRRSMWDTPFAADSGTGVRRGGTIDTNVNVEETDDGYVVLADLPGFEKEDLSIRFEDGVLTIHGETDVAEESDHMTARRSRRVFERMALPETVQEDEITASYQNGVLEIVLPTEEAPEDDSHRIDIE
jgi:HSP20 family protein